MDKLARSVNLKGTNEGYILFLDDRLSLDDIFRDTKELFEKIKKDEKYDESFELIIDTGHRLLTQQKKEEFSKLIKTDTNFEVKSFRESVIDLETANTWHKETSPLLMIKNIRNGQVVRSERDIILLGDVRPGGLVRSTGSIVIIGDVHGTVHAGAKGDESAIIVAPFTYDAQVRIGEHVEIIEVKEEETTSKHQVVYLNDLHVIKFEDVNKLERIRPDFAKDLGGFEEWQKQS